MWYTNEQQAFDRPVGAVMPNSYPVVVTPLDTTGEKAFEEFVGRDETVHDLGLTSIEAVTYLNTLDPDAFRNVFLAAVRRTASPKASLG